MSVKAPEQLHRRVNALVVGSGMTVTELARRTGISRGYLYEILKGRSKPTFPKIEAIADALSVEVKHLVDEAVPTNQIDLRNQQKLLYYWHHRQWKDLLKLVSEEMSRVE